MARLELNPSAGQVRTSSILLVRVLSLLHHQDCMPCASEAARRVPSSHPCLVCCPQACGRCCGTPLDTGAWLCCAVVYCVCWYWAVAYL